MTPLIREAIDKLLDSVGVTTTVAVEDYVRAHFREEFESQAYELASRYIRKEAQSQLSGRGREKQEALPGLSVPRVFTVPTEGGGYCYVSLAKATLSDVDSDLSVKSQNLSAVQAEFDEAVSRRDRLWSVDGACPSMLVLDAIEGLE